MINPNKTKSYRELGQINILALQQKVAQLQESDWSAANKSKPNKFAALGRAKHLVFRFPKSLTSHLESYDTELWMAWKEVIEPIMAEAINVFNYANGQSPRIMLANLPAYSEVKKHIDKSPSAQFPHKIHVPVETNSQSFFYANGKELQMEVGKAYEVNNNQLHWAINGGDTDRIHLIFEYFPTSK